MSEGVAPESSPPADAAQSDQSLGRIGATTGPGTGVAQDQAPAPFWTRLRTVIFSAFGTLLVGVLVAWLGPGGLWPAVSSSPGSQDQGVMASKTINAPAVAVQVETGSTIGLNETVGGFVSAYVIPRPLGELGDPPPADCGKNLGELTRRLGGADAGSSSARVVVQGLANAAVVLAVRVKIVARDPIQSGTYLACRSGGGGLVVPRDVVVNLDDVDPVPKYLVRGRDTGKPFALTVSQGESEIIDLYAKATTGCYLWIAEIDATIDGKRHTFVINDEGRPFRTSGLQPGPKTVYAYSSGDSQWTAERWKEG